MDSQDITSLSPKIVQVITELQTDPSSWVAFTALSVTLTMAGVHYKEYGFQELRPFFNEFSDVLECDEVSEVGKPPVCYVRPKCTDGHEKCEEAVISSPITTSSVCECVPTENSWLTTWASIPSTKYKALADLALDEKWYYGADTEANREWLPILRNYLNYTFKRLCFEKKIIIKKDAEKKRGICCV